MADFLTQATLDALAGIDLGIPEPFQVTLERDGAPGTHIPAGIAPAAVGFVKYLDHAFLLEKQHDFLDNWSHIVIFIFRQASAENHV